MIMRGRWQSLLLGLLICLYDAGTRPMYAQQPRAVVAQRQWQKFSPAKGGFSILMPGSPTEKTQSLDTGVIPVALREFTVLLDRGQVNYTVSYIELPDAIAQTSSSLLLEMFSSALTSDARLKVLSQRDIQLRNYPGKEYSIVDTKKNLVRQRLYLVDRRLYQVAVEVPQAREAALAAQMKNFLDSFQLL